MKFHQLLWQTDQFWHKQQPCQPLRRWWCLHRFGKQTIAFKIGLELTSFWSGQKKVIAISDRVRLHALQITASYWNKRWQNNQNKQKQKQKTQHKSKRQTSWLSHCNRSDCFAAAHARQKALLLFWCAVVHKVRRHNLRVQRKARATTVGIVLLFPANCREEHVQTGTTKFFRNSLFAKVSFLFQINNNKIKINSFWLNLNGSNFDLPIRATTVHQLRAKFRGWLDQL